MCKCSCNKPQLLHKLFSHVIDACYELGNFSWARYVPSYYKKEIILNTCKRTLVGYLVMGSFTKHPKENATYIPDPDPERCQGVGRRKKKRIRNNMDESEAGSAVQLCSKCNNPGHTYKRCPAAHYACNAPSSSNTAPSQPSGSSGRGRGRRGRRNNVGFI